ncbi:class A beta-lactamase [Pseudoroseomonas deserti]|uniref:Beta-lactamase n=1 Tax=Teichococcus deserti TaxID=1817963 RepID=A0A1V2GVP6_9PROT|nr:class A beta-lactamase [Pseudoroseomonas deserti]ONG46048.1 class A beta-lactamase [Pseudoroseomonas deserti]
MTIHRRSLLAAGLALAATPAFAASPLEQRLAEIEARSGGRLGVAILVAGTARHAGHRLDERFPLCSTFKVLAAAAVLARVDAGQEQLDRPIRFTRDQLVAYSPGTEAGAGGPGLPMRHLCEVAVTLSDNTAANLMLQSLGGPAGLTAWLRGLGDATTRLDRIEPELNEGTPGDPRDTTTPLAMSQTLEKLILGNALKPDSRALLTRWLVENKTGDDRLKARLPSGWRAGEKTGTGPRGSTNDAGILWPADSSAPLLVSAYLTGTSAPLAARNAALAEVGKAVAEFYKAI